MVLTYARPLPRFRLEVAFADGGRAQIQVADHLNGEIFEPLREQSYFASGQFDPDSGTIVWPNGANFAPEFLRSMADTALQSDSER